MYNRINKCLPQRHNGTKRVEELSIENGEWRKGEAQGDQGRRT